MYDLYKDEVNDPRYRGLKLWGGRHVNEIKERQFTTSNLDDFKRILDRQK